MAPTNSINPIRRVWLSNAAHHHSKGDDTASSPLLSYRRAYSLFSSRLNFRSSILASIAGDSTPSRTIPPCSSSSTSSRSISSSSCVRSALVRPSSLSFLLIAFPFFPYLSHIVWFKDLATRSRLQHLVGVFGHFQLFHQVVAELLVPLLFCVFLHFLVYLRFLLPPCASKYPNSAS